MVAVQRAALRTVGEDVAAADARIREFVVWATDRDRFAPLRHAAVFEERGHVVAICLFYGEEVVIEGRVCEVIRASMAGLPSHRKRGLLAKAFIALVPGVVGALGWSHPDRYVSGTCMSPLTWYFMCRRARGFYPGPPHPARPRAEAVFKAMYGDAGILTREPVGALETAEVQAWVQRSEHPAMALFRQLNPDYRRGAGIRYVVRVTGLGLCGILARHAAIQTGKRLARVVSPRT